MAIKSDWEQRKKTNLSEKHIINLQNLREIQQIKSLEQQKEV
jgi:hypothetical protein